MHNFQYLLSCISYCTLLGEEKVLFHSGKTGSFKVKVGNLDTQPWMPESYQLPQVANNIRPSTHDVQRWSWSLQPMSIYQKHLVVLVAHRVRLY